MSNFGMEFTKYHKKVMNLFLAIAAVLSFFIMLWITADVFGRDLFNKPLQATFQLSKTLIVIVAALSFAYVQDKRGNIELEFLTKHFSPLWQAILDMFAMVLGFVFFGLIFLGALGWSIETWQIGEYMEGESAFPYWPSRFALTVGAFVVSVTYVLQIIAQGRRVLSLGKGINPDKKSEG